MNRVAAIAGRLLAVIGALALVAIGVFVAHGISARDGASRFEMSLARAARRRE